MPPADDADAPPWRAWVLEPSLLTADLPGIGGRVRACDDDFTVDEIPAYGPDGAPNSWVLLQLRKRGMSTEDALRVLARALGVGVGDIGFAGRKDRDAVSRQWISVPARCAERLAALQLPDIELGPAHPHSHKLRTGHLHGNRFDVVVREPAVELALAHGRVAAKLAALVARGGLPNGFGPQRFGDGGRGLDRGVAAMKAGHGGHKGNMTVAAGQAALFNLYVELRLRRGLLRRALLGDVLKKTDTGGPRGVARGGDSTAHSALHGADAPGAVRGLVREFGDLGLALEPEQRAGVAHAQPTVAQHLLHALGQPQQAHGVGDGAAILADALGELFLGVAANRDQLGEGARLLDGVEVGALQVLDQGELEPLLIVGVADHHRHVVQAGQLRRPPASLAGDDQIARAIGRRGRHAGDDDGLDDALAADAGRELLEQLGIEALARLVGARRQRLDRQVPRHARRGRWQRLGRRRCDRRHGRQQGPQAAAQGRALAGLGCVHARFSTRASTSRASSR